MKYQARMQRSQMRMQMRGMRRSSVVGPLVLLMLGVMFLLAQTGRVSWSRELGWYGTWWPLVLVGAGVILLAEWAFDQVPGPDGTVRPRRSLGGGVVVLLVFLAVVGSMMHFSTRLYEHGVSAEDHFGHTFGVFDHFGEEHDSDDSLSSAIPAGGTLIVRNPRGDISISGDSTDGQIHVSVHKEAWAWQQSDADEKQNKLQPTFSVQGGTVSLSVASVEGGQADLTVQVPSGTAVTMQADRGNLSANNLQGALILTANHGDVDLNDITGGVTAHINDDDAHISGHSITGTVLVEGRTGNVELSDVTGGVTLQGDFFGTTHLEHINGLTRFQTSRTQFEAARVDGEFEVETGPDLTASEVLGPVVLTTKNRNITLERVQGSVKVINRNGTVSVTSTTPIAPITITNQHGSVDLGLPGHGGFLLDATTRHGDMENDFGLSTVGEDGQQQTLKGTIAGGGPSVTIGTTDGDVTVRKSEVEPLPPLPPLASAPAAPSAAKSPKAMSAPKAPHAPQAPAAPKAMNF
jgi:DUF4097 and DUF4098 domain-containing protein YvlB